MEHAANLHRQGRLDAAAAIYREILAREPRDFDATHLLGVIALQQGNYQLAQRLIGAAITISPLSDAAIGNLGVSYLSAGEPASAYEWFAAALILAPDSSSHLLHAAAALQRLGRHGEAAPLLTKAFEVDPAAPEAWRRLAAADTVRRTAGDPEFRRPAASLLLQTACALLASGYNEQALQRLRRAVEFEPDNLRARWVMALAPLEFVYATAAQIEPSRAAFARAIAEIATWYRERGDAIKEPYKALGVAQPFALAYQAFNNRELMMRYGELCVTLMKTLPIEPAARADDIRAPPRSVDSPERIRLGIASPHIKVHSVWTAITKGLVHHLDRSRFEIHLFQLNRDSDEETRSARALASSVEDRPTSVEGWARAIKLSDLDVLLYPSVGMEPLTQQLAALRLAPLQAASWGHPETTGFPTMDLFLSGELLEPETAADNYNERLVRLPNLGVYVEPLGPPETSLDLAALGLPSDEPLLLCAGTPFKYSPQFDEVWVKIAQGLRKRLFGRSKGRLVFFRSRISAMDQALEKRLRTAFANAGIDFDSQVCIISLLDRASFYALLRRSALLLDTLGFSGFNTAIQAIECDLPVLAYEGEFMRGRLASALLRRLDLPNLVASTPQRFIDMAIDLARDAGKRSTLRAAIGERRQALFRDPRPVRALEEHLAREVSMLRASGRRAPTNIEGLMAAAADAARGGDAQGALAAYSCVIELHPDHAPAHYKFGNVLKDQSRLEGALASYDRAISIDPGFAHALCNRGVVLDLLERPTEALDSYERALAQNPSDSVSHHNRAMVLRKLKRFDEALKAFDCAIEINPSYAEAYCNRGTLLQDLKEWDAALASYDRSIQIYPGLPLAYFNRGVLLAKQDPPRALADYDKAIALAPLSADAHCNRGILLARLKRPLEGLAGIDRAIELDPGLIDAHFGRAEVLVSMNRVDAAIDSYDRALNLDPAHPFLAGSRWFAKMLSCDWRGFETEVPELAARIESGLPVAPPFQVLALIDDPVVQQAAARTWIRENFPADPSLLAIKPADPRPKIHLGYFSADFRDHPVGLLMAELIELHDRSNFEVTAFAFGPDTQDPLRKRLERGFDRYVDIRDMPDSEVCALARELRVDIAIDLGGHTAESRTRIFAMRAAPIQVNYLGYPGTMGADYIDYLVADSVVIPKSLSRQYTEQIVRLPHSLLPNDSTRAIAEATPSRQKCGLPANAFVFCCFNNSYKINPPVFDVWMKLLHRIENSVLWLSPHAPGPAGNLRDEAVRRGIDPTRLIFTSRATLQSEYLARLRLGDLFLDTLPYNAHTTAIDALWAGLPVLTRIGQGFAGRVAASLLQAVGLPELITATIDEYQDLAAELAQSPDRLATIRRRLSERKFESPLFQTALLTKHLESAYRKMHERRLLGLPRDPITIEPEGD